MKGLLSGIVYYIGSSTVKKSKNGHGFCEVYLSRSTAVEEGGEVEIYRWWASQPTPNLEVMLLMLISIILEVQMNSLNFFKVAGCLD